MADEGDHVAASAKNQAGPPRLSHLRVNPPQTLTMMDLKEEDWKLWKQEWKNNAKITQLDKHCAGRNILRIYNHNNAFEFTTGESDINPQTVLEKLDDYFTGEINETMERFNFNKRNQVIDENVVSCVTCLRTLAKTCNFCDTCGDSLICDRLIIGIRYEGYENSQADLLKVGKLTLNECINICRSAEATKGHMKLMSSIVIEDIHKVYVRSKYNPKRPVSDRGKHQKYSAKGTMSRCKFCGQEHVFKKSECPA